MARVVITGCSTGFGRATALELADRGHEVVATARRVETLNGLKVARRLQLDVDRDDSVAALRRDTITAMPVTILPTTTATTLSTPTPTTRVAGAAKGAPAAAAPTAAAPKSTATVRKKAIKPPVRRKRAA